LALSSRNAYLSVEQRSQATCLYRALRHAEARIRAGAASAADVVAEARRIVEDAGPCRIDYIEIVDRESLRPADALAGSLIVALAVHIGGARLIDNLMVDASPPAS
jgi:pantoate--beta-alanine ligase